VTALLADAVYIATTDAVQTARPNVMDAPTIPAALSRALGFLKAVCVKPILPYAALFEANFVGAMVSEGDVVPPDPFSSESAFLSPMRPHA